MLKYSFFKRQQWIQIIQRVLPLPHAMAPRICVDSCPTSNLTSHVCWDEDSASTVRTQGHQGGTTLVRSWTRGVPRGAQVSLPDLPTEEYNMSGSPGNCTGLSFSHVSSRCRNSSMNNLANIGCCCEKLIVAYFELLVVNTIPDDLCLVLL